MTRVIKFRVFNKLAKVMTFGGISILNSDGILMVAPDCEVMQFTGLLDKNGKEIYEGDILKWENYWKCNCGKDFNQFEVKGYVQMWGGCWVASTHELGNEHNEPMYLTQFAVSRDKEYDNYYPKDMYLIREVEIIGNIHETPELLLKK